MTNTTQTTQTPKMTRAAMVDVLTERADDACRAWENANVTGNKRAARAAKRRFLRAVATRQILENGYQIRVRAARVAK